MITQAQHFREAAVTRRKSAAQYTRPVIPAPGTLPSAMNCATRPG